MNPETVDSLTSSLDNPLAVLASAVGDERAAAMLREFITEEVLGQVAALAAARESLAARRRARGGRGRRG